MYICTYVHIYMYICMYSMYVSMYVCIYVCMYDVTELACEIYVYHVDFSKECTLVTGNVFDVLKYIVEL